MVSLLCCPSCRLRFSPVAATYLLACPECGAPPTVAAGSENLMGYRLLDPLDGPEIQAEAIAVSLPVPPLDGRWTP
jgi:hypothetical protein